MTETEATPIKLSNSDNPEAFLAEMVTILRSNPDAVNPRYADGFNTILPGCRYTRDEFGERDLPAEDLQRLYGGHTPAEHCGIGQWFANNEVIRYVEEAAGAQWIIGRLVEKGHIEEVSPTVSTLAKQIQMKLDTAVDGITTWGQAADWIEQQGVKGVLDAEGVGFL